MEASGGCESLLLDYAWGREICALRVNAGQVRDFAESLGILEETDDVDARVITHPPSGLSIGCALTQWCLVKGQARSTWEALP